MKSFVRSFEKLRRPCSPMAFAAMTLDTPKVARASATTGMILRLTTSMPRAVRGSQRCWMYSETVGTEFAAEATEKEGERVHEGRQTDRLSKGLSRLFDALWTLMAHLILMEIC